MERRVIEKPLALLSKFSVHLLYALGLAGLFGGHWLHTGAAAAAIAASTLGYTALLLWSVLVLKRSLRSAVIDVQSIVGFLFCAVSTPAFGRVYEQAFGGSKDAFAIYCHAATLACIIGPMIGARRARRKRPPPGTCSCCGYLLVGLPEPRCPECGTPFKEAPEAVAKE